MNVEPLLKDLGFSFSKPEELAASVKKLSDFYIANPTSPTPWNETWAQAAYLAYFLPLNYARVRVAVAKAAQAGFFDGLDTMIDFGSGLGAGELAVTKQKENWQSIICHDRNIIPMQLHARLTASKNIRWEKSFPDRLPDPRNRLAVFSYVYTELKALPQWAHESEALLIVEPSTRDDGRRLQALRGELLKQGFKAFAPCPHQRDCPLLVDSEKDWCHDRVDWSGDENWQKLERFLPMKNRTLTFSYLAVRKTRSPELPSGHLGRMVGDQLVEKGKTRQLLCRDSHRQFLAWFPQRLKADLELKRGDLVRLREDLEMKANELRVKSLSSVETIALPKTEL